MMTQRRGVETMRPASTRGTTSQTLLSILALCRKYSKVLTLEIFLYSRASEGWVDSADVMDLIAQFEKSWDSLRVLLPRLAALEALGEASGEGAIPGTIFSNVYLLNECITGECLRISQDVREACR